MKKSRHSIHVICVLFFILNASAQTPKKVALMGVTTGFADFGKQEEITDMFYQVQPGLGLFIHEKIALGLFVNVSSFGYNDFPYTAYGIGPFARLMTKNFFFQASWDFGLATDEIFPYSKITVASGYALHVSPLFAFEPQVIFVGYNEEGDFFDFSGPGLGLGFQFYLYSKK